MFADFLKIIFYDPEKGWVEDVLDESGAADEEDKRLQRSFEELLK